MGIAVARLQEYIIYLHLENDNSCSVAVYSQLPIAFV